MVDSSGYLIDPNVLLDVFTDDPEWGDWSAETLTRVIRSGPLLINRSCTQKFLRDSETSKNSMHGCR